MLFTGKVLEHVINIPHKQSKAPDVEGTFWDDASVLTLDCGDGCTILIYQKSLNCYLTMGEFYGMYITV